MANLSAERYIKKVGADAPAKIQIGVDGSAAKIWEGAMVGVLTATGMAVRGGTAASSHVMGVAENTADNSGSATDGAISVNLLQGLFWFANSAGGDEITAVEVGKVVYVVDDQTVSKTNSSNTRPIAGLCVGVDTTDGVCVYISAALNEALEADQSDFAVDLASTANALGASLVGIEDAAANFAATNVETALAEIVADLAATTATNGASRIGVQDSAGIIAATNVETALAEIAAILSPGGVTKIQVVTGTLVAGTCTITVGAGQTVTAATKAFPIMSAIVTGSANFGCLAHLIASNVVGGSAVGQVVIRALGSDGAQDVDAAGLFAAILIN